MAYVPAKYDKVKNATLSLKMILGRGYFICLSKSNCILVRWISVSKALKNANMNSILRLV